MIRPKTQATFYHQKKIVDTQHLNAQNKNDTTANVCPAEYQKFYGKVFTFKFLFSYLK